MFDEIFDSNIDRRAATLQQNNQLGHNPNITWIHSFNMFVTRWCVIQLLNVITGTIIWRLLFSFVCQAMVVCACDLIICLCSFCEYMNAVALIAQTLVGIPAKRECVCVLNYRHGMCQALSIVQNWVRECVCWPVIRTCHSSGADRQWHWFGRYRISAPQTTASGCAEASRGSFRRRGLAAECSDTVYVCISMCWIRDKAGDHCSGLCIVFIALIDIRFHHICMVEQYLQKSIRDFFQTSLYLISDNKCPIILHYKCCRFDWIQ